VFSNHPDDLILGADTIVTLEGEVLGKPADRDDARRMLKRLSGRSHRVYTGVCLMAFNQKTVFAQWADVTVAPLTEEEISVYVETGECDDKAGAYAVQGLGSRFIEKIDGDYYTVVGLPVQNLYRVLCCSPFTNYLL
jgi:septum formation protein